AQQALFGAALRGTCGGIGIEVDRIVYVFKRPEASAQGDADDPGGRLGAQIEGMRLAPYDQHRVIEDFIDQLRPAGHPLEKSPEPRVIAAEERLESRHVAAGNLADERDLVSRFRQPVPRSCLGFGVFATRHSCPPCHASGKAAVGAPLADRAWIAPSVNPIRCEDIPCPASRQSFRWRRTGSPPRPLNRLSAFADSPYARSMPLPPRCAPVGKPGCRSAAQGMHVFVP